MARKKSAPNPAGNSVRKAAEKKRAARRRTPAPAEQPQAEPEAEISALPTHALVSRAAAGAPLGYYPSGSLDEIKTIYRHTRESLKGSADDLAAFENEVQIFELKRQPEYDLLKPSLGERATSVLEQRLNALNDELNDPAALQARAKKAAELAADKTRAGIKSAAETLRGMAEGRRVSFWALAKAGTKLVGSVHGGLSRGIESASTAFNQVRNEMKPQTAQGLMASDGRCYVSATWLVEPGNSMLLDNAPALLGQTRAPRRDGGPGGPTQG